MIRWIDRDGNVSARAGPINGKSNAEQNRTRAANIKRVIGFSSNRTKFALLNEDRQKFILSQSSNRWPSADQLNQFVGRNRRLRDRRRVSQSIFEPVAAGSIRNIAVALAAPRPLASLPCALTRAV